MNFVVTWIFCHPINDIALYPQVGERVDSLEVQNYFWRCAFCLFASSHRLNSEARHILFCNQHPPTVIDGTRVSHLIDQYKIELHDLPSITRPPHDYHNAWNSQFIVLDVMDGLCKLMGTEDVCFILDADCVFNRPISREMELSVSENRALLYSIDYPLDYKINGLSRNELGSLAAEYSPQTQRRFVYNGGEIICALGEKLRQIAVEARAAYDQSVKRHHSGCKKFNEEAQLLSYVYQKLDLKSHTANKYIKRMWTDSSTSRNITNTESELVIWHVPSEKKRGFVKLFRSLARRKEIDPEYISIVLNVKRSLAAILTQYFRLIVKRLVNRQALRPSFPGE